MKGVFLILAVFLLASCGQEHDADVDDGTPRVRLVKGNEVLFHTSLGPPAPSRTGY
jgi:hypothetical protein